MLKTVISWTNCILNICLILLFQVLNMPSKYGKFRNLGHLQTPFQYKIPIFFYGPSVTYEDGHSAKNEIG